MSKNSGRSRIGVRAGALAIVLACIGLAGPTVRAADARVDLDNNPANGAESRVETKVVQSYPVKIENTIFNNAPGKSYTFAWPGAGPGGFDSMLTLGPDVGTKWEWTTVSQVYSINAPIDFINDPRDVPAFGTPSGGGVQTIGTRPMSFSVPGKSIYPTQVTVSSTTLTSSLVTFFSPEKQVATCSGTFTPGRFEQTITNTSGQPITFSVEQQDCCPEAQMTICDDGCKFYLTDVQNCGGCGIECAWDEYCNQGGCEPICPTGQALCGEDCVDLSSDPLNCGDCGNACASDEVCADGSCELVCPVGQLLCGGVCIDPLTDHDHCGSCDTQCDDDEYCGGGMCQEICPGQTLCGESCVDLLSDPLNCGACGNVCGTNAICTGGSCYTCRAPRKTACNNECVNTNTDPYNCGGCGNVCDFSGCPSSGQGQCSHGSSCICSDGSTASTLSSSLFAEPAPTRDRRPSAASALSPRLRDDFTPARGGERFGRVAPQTAAAGASRALDVVEAPVCSFPPVTQTLESGGSYTQCINGALVGKEVFATAVIQVDGQTIGQGPCAQIVPDPDVTMQPFLPSPVAVAIVDESGDGLCQPGETCDAFISVQNLGTEGLPNPVATLSSPPDAFNPLPLAFVNDTATYPDFPAFDGAGSCDQPAQLDPKTNFVPFTFTVPEDQDPDVGRVFTLSFQAGGARVPTEMPLVLGLGKACDPLTDLDGESFDRLDGLLSPFDARLVPAGTPVHESTGNFNPGSTVPLKLRLGCGPLTLSGDQLALFPQIVSVVHSTLGPQPLEFVNGDNNANPADPFFSCGSSRCEFQLRTDMLPVGHYVVGIKLPDSRVFQAGFVLRP